MWLGRKKKTLLFSLKISRWVAFALSLSRSKLDAAAWLDFFSRELGVEKQEENEEGGGEKNTSFLGNNIHEFLLLLPIQPPTPSYSGQGSIEQAFMKWLDSSLLYP